MYVDATTTLAELQISLKGQYIKHGKKSWSFGWLPVIRRDKQDWLEKERPHAPDRVAHPTLMFILPMR
jgi:hypothetical protein